MSKKISIGPIKRRAVLYIHDKDLYRFPGWALTTTTLGTMAEPFDVTLSRPIGGGVVDYDPSDPAVRIDEMRQIRPGTESGYIMGDERVTGGNLHPREFLKSGNFV